jgi:two-component system, OmpR family, sensor histidine kinase VicK
LFGSADVLAPPLFEREEKEKLEIWSGVENINKKALDVMYRIRSSYDVCIDRDNPAVILTNDPITKAYFDLAKRGVKIRFITEITRENLSLCKKIMKIAEMRHLDAIKGNFVIADREGYAGVANSKDGRLYQLIACTVETFVEQQEYLFETLWNKAIPAKQRIREIEEGTKREVLDTIRDPYEIQKIGFDLINKAEEEILIVFSTANAFRRQEKAGALELLKEAAKLRGVKVRILVPIGNNDKNGTLGERIQQIKDAGIDIRTIKQTLQNKLSTLIVDQSLCLTVELKDDTLETSDEAIGLATYSNSEATVFSYVSIFENLWIQTQLHKRR